jgi:predicted SnoaL-like aldol condensation-catalyzing enzyme
MKKLTFAAIIAMVCFISCQEKSTTTTNNAERNTERNNAVYRAMETGDVSKLDSFIDKDIVDHEHGEIKGRDALMKMFGEMHTHMSGLKFDLITDATSANGEYHFAWFKMKGTCTDGSMGMPAGTKMDMTGVDLVRIKDDKAVEHWGFADPNEMMKHMKEMPMDNGKMDNKMDNGKMENKMAPKDSIKK